MIKFDRFQLENGLKVIVHKTRETPIVAFNLLYDVGARDENPERTGFAHLFEHLMFGGSINIPQFDTPLQKAGGENNAFTSNDITNYYITIPKQNLETAFWLESDRMLSLAFSEKSLEVQRNVVMEEFKQRYLNQPYGDVFLYLRPLAYKKHPYQWSTIGKNLEQIETASMQEVKDFFYSRYAPNNAVLVIAGDVETDDIKKLAEKWFGPIEKRKVPKRNLPKEPKQDEARFLELKRDVPYNAIYKAYHMCGKKDKNYYESDLISDILSNGKSARLNRILVKEKKLFSDINAYIFGSTDPGLLIINGTVLPGVNMKKADQAIEEITEELRNNNVTAYELEKVQNKVEATIVFTEAAPLNVAMNLAFHELTGKAENINDEIPKYRNVTPESLKNVANKILSPQNCSTIYYLSKNQ